MSWNYTLLIFKLKKDNYDEKFKVKYQNYNYLDVVKSSK